MEPAAVDTTQVSGPATFIRTPTRAPHSSLGTGAQDTVSTVTAPFEGTRQPDATIATSAKQVVDEPVAPDAANYDNTTCK